MRVGYELWRFEHMGYFCLVIVHLDHSHFIAGRQMRDPACCKVLYCLNLSRKCMFLLDCGQLHVEGIDYALVGEVAKEGLLR